MRPRLILLLALALLAACADDVQGGADPADWEDLFQERVLEEQPGCTAPATRSSKER
jgi:outer membrane biogenesis lipoprotein LolB